jgi:ferric-dicitrate binding protein FerR (iron transport regulator)
MEQRNYEWYTTEDFVLDKEFAHWVLFPNAAEDLFWMSFQTSHPEKADLIKEAALIINSLKPIEPEIPEEKLNQIFRKINYQRNTRRKVINLTLKYAATVAFLLAIGTILWLSVKTNDSFPVEASLNSPQKGKVILSNGSVREFETEKTIIKQTASGKIAINSDTVNVVPQEKTNNTPGLNQVIIPYGKRSEITLADGTHIWLNSGSQLSYPQQFDKKIRKVYLSGEAFFDVAPDKTKPFYVITSDFKIRVLGTKFNVSAYKEDQTTQTVLLEGKVSAGKNTFLAETVDLCPGERLVYDKKNETMRKDQVDVNLYASWINGYLLFENEPTTAVFKKLERYYDQRIITNEKLDKITFSGKLDLRGNIRDVLENISFASQVKVTEDNGQFIIN